MSTDTIKDLEEYRRRDLAGTHPSTAGSQRPADPKRVATIVDALDRDGYAVIPNLLDPALVADIREDLRPRFMDRCGRNNFEGKATKRLYALIDKTLVCNPLVEHPLVLGVLDRLFAPNYLLSQLQAIDILPGETQQPLHYDDGMYPVPRPRPPLGAATIFAIDEFTAQNGATVVIPGSHRWGDRVPTPEDERRAIPVVMPAGSAVLFTGTLWHAGGANRTDAARLCVTAQYCAPWCRQQENFFLSIGRDRVRQCSEHIQRMLGYSIHPPFVGFVNGMHPKRVLAQP